MNNVIHCSSIYYIYGEVITRKLGLDSNFVEQLRFIKYVDQLKRFLIK
jgi:hypothetical protein